jgi:hypothetical protein
MAKITLTKKELALIGGQLIKNKKYQNYANQTIKNKVNEIKTKILEEFNKHPVTVEIEQGIEAENISGTLSGLNTNLYSYIGFEQGSKPIQPIREALNEIKITANHNNKVSKYKIEFPTAKDIFDISPMPWAKGRSWAKGIELGISGIGFLLLNRPKYSRSKSAIQVKNQVRTGFRFKNVKYISYIINKYKKEIKKIEKQIL